LFRFSHHRTTTARPPHDHPTHPLFCPVHPVLAMALASAWRDVPSLRHAVTLLLSDVTVQE
jgi:hypothetical protein